MHPPSAETARLSPSRVCVDLNVFIAAELAAQRGRSGGLPERILTSVENREIVLVLSLNMAERLAERLEDRAGLSRLEAVRVASAYAALADPPGLLTRTQPVIALGQGPHAEEDGRVMEAALAGHAGYLVTYNIADFLRATSPHRATGRPAVLGVEILRPVDLALTLGWPLRMAPRAQQTPATRAKAPKRPGGGRKP